MQHGLWRIGIDANFSLAKRGYNCNAIAQYCKDNDGGFEHGKKLMG